MIALRFYHVYSGFFDDIPDYFAQDRKWHSRAY